MTNLNIIESKDRRTEPADTILSADRVKPPTVSVIVTNYNYGAYLEACLDSIAQQSYARFDCVVVDDVSSDHSVEVIEAFIERRKADSDQRFRLVRHEHNQGQMGAFKTGLAQSTGTFVVFVDADDILLPDFIDTHLKAHLNASYAVAFTCSDQLQINDNGELVGGTYPKVHSKRGGYEGDDLGGLPEHFHWDFDGDETVRLRQQAQALVYLPAVSYYFSNWFWSTTSAMMYRRATLELILSPDCDEFRICADYYLVTFSQAIGGSIVIPTVHGCYRRHGKNGFSQGFVIGGEHPPGNHLIHPPYGKFNMSFVQHVIRDFEDFATALGLPRAYMLIARFAPRGMFRGLMLKGVRNDLITRRALLRYRLAWKAFKAYGEIRSRVRLLRKIVSTRQ